MHCVWVSRANDSLKLSKSYILCCHTDSGVVQTAMNNSAILYEPGPVCDNTHCTTAADCRIDTPLQSGCFAGKGDARTVVGSSVRISSDLVGPDLVGSRRSGSLQLIQICPSSVQC